MQNEEAKQALQQPVLTTQRDYLLEKLEFEAYRRQVEKRLNLLYILVSILAMIVVVFAFLLILRKSKRVINGLEKERDGISVKLQKLDEDKKEADKTIENLKNEIDRNEKENNSRITDLLQKLDSDKEKSNRSIAELKQALAAKVKESDSMASLFEKMEQERNVARQTIRDLNDLVSQKEESRTNMAALIQKLENDSKLNAVTITSLREGLQQHSAHAAELFRDFNSDMSELLVVVKEKKVAVSGICKVVYRWKED